MSTARGPRRAWRPGSVSSVAGPPRRTRSGSDGSKATAGSRRADTAWTPSAGSSPARASSSSIPREGPALIGLGGGCGGFKLRIEPDLDSVAHDLVQPALEAVGLDLGEPIVLDLLALADLEEPKDEDALRARVDDGADVADLLE